MRGAIGNSYSSSDAAREHLARDEQQQRVEIRRDGERRVAALVQVVREPAGAGALHQRAPEAARVAAQHRDDLAQPGRVFLLSPGPVALQVDVVVSQALLERQPGADAAMRGLAHAALVQSQRRQQRREPAHLVVVGRGHVFEPPACGLPGFLSGA